MEEHVVTFGKDGNLHGVITHPVSTASRTHLAIVFLNAGLVHKVGPYRQWVDLARRLAARGFTSFRFDFSGLGDSESSSHTGNDVERCTSECKEALDALQERTGLNQCIIIGLCSGADYGHPFALRDTRVCGVVMLDGYGYPTEQFIRNQKRMKWLSVRRWSRRFLKLVGRRTPEDLLYSRENPSTYTREFPNQDQVQRELKEITNRGAKLLFLYTSGVSDYYNYAEQFWEMFPHLTPSNTHNRIEVEYFPLASHTYTFLEDREVMFTRIEKWLSAFDG